MASGRKPGRARVGARIYVLAKNNSDPARSQLGPGSAPVGGGSRAAADLRLPGRAALARFPWTVPGPARTVGPASHPGHSAAVPGSRAQTKVPAVHSSRSCGYPGLNLCN